MLFKAKVPKLVFFLLIIAMYAYAFASGIAITHTIGNDADECPYCVHAEVAEN